MFPLSLRGVKRRSNPQTTNSKYKNRKEKEFTTIHHLRHCEQSEAIHKPLITNTKTEKKEFTTFNQVKELILNEILIFNFQFSISYVSIFNFQFSIFSQPPCCFATSPLTKGGKPHKPLIINTKTENKKNPMNK